MRVDVTLRHARSTQMSLANNATASFAELDPSASADTPLEATNPLDDVWNIHGIHYRIPPLVSQQHLFPADLEASLAGTVTSYAQWVRIQKEKAQAAKAPAEGATKRGRTGTGGANVSPTGQRGVTTLILHTYSIEGHRQRYIVPGRRRARGVQTEPCAVRICLRIHHVCVREMIHWICFDVSSNRVRYNVTTTPRSFRRPNATSSP